MIGTNKTILGLLVLSMTILHLVSFAISEQGETRVENVKSLMLQCEEAVTFRDGDCSITPNGFISCDNCFNICKVMETYGHKPDGRFAIYDQDGIKRKTCCCIRFASDEERQQYIAEKLSEEELKQRRFAEIAKSEQKERQEILVEPSLELERQCKGDAFLAKLCAPSNLGTKFPECYSCYSICMGGIRDSYKADGRFTIMDTERFGIPVTIKTCCCIKFASNDERRRYIALHSKDRFESIGLRERIESALKRYASPLPNYLTSFT